MAYLNDALIGELTAPALANSTVTITRGPVTAVYTLLDVRGRGMKGVVWKGKDDLGHDVAVKFIPADDYHVRALIDEISEALKLGSELFATIKFFGDAEFAPDIVTTPCKSVVTEWLDGLPLDRYLRDAALAVRDFQILAKHLFRAVATLRRYSLCHEDLHPGNILLEERSDALTGEKLLFVKIIDTGTIKRLATRDRLLHTWRTQLDTLRAASGDPTMIRALEQLIIWKTPDDHLRIVDCLLHAANALAANYHRLDFWERRFIDQLPEYFARLTDRDRNSRLDDPKHALDELFGLVHACQQLEHGGGTHVMASPFDYISAEMIQTDAEFGSLFSEECPWLRECVALQPLYIYGPRGCGKSSVLRWLSFKVQATQPGIDFNGMAEVGIYISCSVELRSRFWLFQQATLDELEAPIIRYFVLLLLEELFDTMGALSGIQKAGRHSFGIDATATDHFADWFISRLGGTIPPSYLRMRGQEQFTFLRNLTRKLRWDTWAGIQRRDRDHSLSDPSLLADVCRTLSDSVPFLRTRHLTFLLDDYSNQRIPAHLQVKLNQTISFAKQGTPIFKVSSEYNGVDLTGIQEGRDVAEINVGERYTSLPDNKDGVAFLCDILNKRLEKAGYAGRVADLLGKWELRSTIQKAIRDESAGGQKFYYYGIEAIHLICSGDLALALDLVRRIFDAGGIDESSDAPVPAHVQHRTIKNFSNEELRRIKYVAPFGSELYEIVLYIGGIARAVASAKSTAKRDRPPEPLCKTHLDIRTSALRALDNDAKLATLYSLLTSRAILITLESSRSRIEGLLERLQLRRAYLPAFQAPLKRDVPIKLDTPDDVISLLTNPAAFAERELKKSDIDATQLTLALREIEAIDVPLPT